MSRVLAWVIGRGGLLGSNTERILGKSRGVQIWVPALSAFSWEDAGELSDQFDKATSRFAQLVTQVEAPWWILWCAGAGVVGNKSSQLRREVSNWELFLRILDRRLRPRTSHLPGTIFLASSAGGVFGTTGDSPHTELSQPEPISDYGRAKFDQEEILKQWASTHRNVSCLIGRISNLYGPEQKLEKGQGLISQISSCLIHRRPTLIYVSLDTLRDYLYAEDCARLIAGCLDKLQSQIERAGRPLQVTKIIASCVTSSVAEILGVFRETIKKSPQIIMARFPIPSRQPRGSALRSLVWPDLIVDHPTSLATGITNVHRHHLKLFQRGLLPPPAEAIRALYGEGA